MMSASPRPQPSIRAALRGPGYTPAVTPRNSPMGRIDATTSILLHKMIADSYEHGRVIWKENKRRRALTGEPESDELPCGPNKAQKRVAEWLISAGLLAADDDDDSSDEESDILSPPSSPIDIVPQSPQPVSWSSRFKLVRSNSKSASDPILSSPRRLVSSLKRTVSALPSPITRQKSKPVETSPPTPTIVTSNLSSSLSAEPSSPKTPRRPSWDGSESLLTTAFRRAAMLGTITEADAEAIIQSYRNPPDLPPSRSNATSTSSPSTPPRTPVRPQQFPDPASYRWPTPPPPEPEPPRASLPSKFELSTADTRWYHVVVLFFLWHVAIASLCSYALFRVFYKPLLYMVVLYYVVFGTAFLCSFFW